MSGLAGQAESVSAAAASREKIGGDGDCGGLCV